MLCRFAAGSPSLSVETSAVKKEDARAGLILHAAAFSMTLQHAVHWYEPAES